MKHNTSNFYQFFTGLMPEIKRLKNGAQIVSGLTAAVGIWYIVAPKLAAFHWLVSMAVALLLVGLSITIIEGGLRKLAPFAIRQAVWSNFSNKWWCIMFVPVALVTMALMTSTTALSWFASPEIISQVTPTADTTSITSIAQTYDARRAAIVSQFEQQIETAQTTGNSEKQATASKYDTKAKNYKRRAKKDVNSSSWLNVLAGKESDKKRAALAKISTKQSEQLAAINEAQNNALASLDSERAAIVGGAISSNNQLIESVQSSVNLWGRFLAWLAAGATILFFFCVFIEEVFSRGSVEDGPPPVVPAQVKLVSNTENKAAVRFVETAETPLIATTNTETETETKDERKQRKSEYDKLAATVYRCHKRWRQYTMAGNPQAAESNQANKKAAVARLNLLGYKVKKDSTTVSGLQVDSFLKAPNHA